MTDNKDLQTATLGTGCFWCTEAIFQSLEGVHSVESGYAGGHVENPTYEEVCSKTTGHAEVVQIVFDRNVISYEKLLEIFWRVHNPTTPDRQGNDVGPQYRSAIFYHDEEQREVAGRSMQETDESDLWADPIVTEISPYANYYPAEDYHQNYFKRVGHRNPYCTYIIAPKMKKFKKEFEDRLKDK